MPLPYWSRQTSILRTHTSSCGKSICAGSEYGCSATWQSSFTLTLFALMARGLSSTVRYSLYGQCLWGQPWTHMKSSDREGVHDQSTLVARVHKYSSTWKVLVLWNYCQTRRTHGFGIKMALERRFSLRYRLFSIIYNHINVLMVAPKSERFFRELSLWWSPSTPSEIICFLFLIQQYHNRIH